MTSRRLGAAFAAALAVAAIGAVGGPAAAEPPGADRGGAAAPTRPTLVPDGRTYRVTLLTGDVVTVTGRTKGCPAVSVRTVAHNGAPARICGPDGHVRVVPTAAAHLVGTVLDPALFDVTALILNGYDDAASADIPLIVRPAPGLRSLAADPLTANLSGRRTLPSIGAVAGRTPKAAGSDLLRTLSGPAARSTAGATKVWLDRRVHPTANTTGAMPAATTTATTTARRGSGSGGLDANLRQVSAPQAWAAGFTGKGVRLAVLDTGADFTHPDLAGRVVERADFTDPAGDAVDRNGHGTHVAATAAGSGAAAPGDRKGVAPEASLLIGKVMHDSGGGAESEIIAGMEWAAARADVVNLSLGTAADPSGNDPMSQAVDALTAQTGALFVISAGNGGPGYRTVGTPGTAATALTVGAVDGTDTIAPFSSRGPLYLTRAAKPELVAPGVDIVAARAAGTAAGRPVDARHVVLSGTSMAAPHVAGAAALLAQRHPTWTAAQLKAALTGAADPAGSADVHTVGAGRLDAAAALDGVVADQSVTAAQPATTLSWTNTGATAAQVRLDAVVVDHDGRPAGPATVSAQTLALAPGASGSATLTVDRNRPPGLYAAVVTARSAAGAVLARTPVTFEVQAPTHTLTLPVGPPPGEPLPPSMAVWVDIQVVNLDDPAAYREYLLPDPGTTVTAAVPAGRYSVTATYQLFNPFTPENNLVAFLGDPDIDVRADTTVPIDPARANRIGATVDGTATTTVDLAFTRIQHPRRGNGWFSLGYVEKEAAAAGNILVEPTDGVTVGRFEAVATFGLQATESVHYDVIHPYGVGIPADPTHRVTAAEQARMGRLDQRFHRVDDEATAYYRMAFTDEGVPLSDHRSVPPQTRTDRVTPGYRWAEGARYGAGINVEEPPRQIAAGSVATRDWGRLPLRSDWYDDPAGPTTQCALRPPTRTRGTVLVELSSLTDRHQRVECGNDWTLAGITRSLRLYRDGSLIGQTGSFYGYFDVPAGAGDYRLAYDVEPGPAVGVSSRVSTEWTFRSTGPAGTGTQPLALLSVDYDLAGRQGGFAVRQAHGVKAQRITAFQVWTSVDGGGTWQPVAVSRTGAATFRAAALPAPTAGQPVSLRVNATGDAGSAISQTIIGAYR